ncbi:MAG: hypothetical protein ACI3XI_00470 [Eubacteriales bacterium]
MIRKRIISGIAIVAALLLSVVGCDLIFPGEYVPGDDEIVLHVQMNTQEDIGLLVYDYGADNSKLSGGISNADRSPIKKDSELVIVWNRRELAVDSDTTQLRIQFRIITEYVDPNYENVYPADVTRYLDPISFTARFGESYHITVTGDKTNGYKALLIDNGG